MSKEGCIENFGMSLTNNFVFGERRVLVAGQAAGFLNMMAEGMSCAMHSGAIAGESIVESFTRNRDANAVYDHLVQSERTRTVDQWNPLKVVFDMPHEADLKAAIMKFPLADRAYMVKEMLAYIGQFRGFGWVAPILSAAARRLFLGRYLSAPAHGLDPDSQRLGRSTIVAGQRARAAQQSADRTAGHRRPVRP